MPTSNSLPSFQPNAAVETREGRAHSAVPTTPPPLNAPGNGWPEQAVPTRRLTETLQQTPAPALPPGTAALDGFPARTTTEGLFHVPVTPSLTSALQAAMSPGSGVAVRPVVVIPGNRKRTQVLPETVQPPRPPRRMPRRLRHGIAIGVIACVLALTFVSLAPLDNGQSSYRAIGGVIEWVKTEHQDWSIIAHNTQQDQQIPTQNDGGAGTSTGGAPPAMILPTSQYIAIARQDAIDAGIPPDYFVRQINLESGFNPNAVSPYGAVGIAQFLPSTAAGIGVNPWDPISSLRGAAMMMASSTRQYGGDYAKALAAYNAGSANVDYAVRNCGANWISCLPGETQNYLRVIMGI